jgi:hypothetical protein
MSSWARVLLNNLLSVPFQPIFIALTREYERYSSLDFNIYHLGILMLFAIMGVMLAWAGAELRSVISATSFTLTSVVYKVVTVGINFVMWDRHANVIGTLSLLLCLIGATVYVPSETRTKGNFSDQVWNGMDSLFCGKLRLWELEAPQNLTTDHGGGINNVLNKKMNFVANVNNNNKTEAQYHLVGSEKELDGQQDNEAQKQ